jgi:tRNA-guanine transglycosylase
VEVLKKAGGIHKLADYHIPLMSDSGGFQVFSLAQTAKRKAHVRGDEDPLVLKISEDGVKFRSVYDGATIEFTPETSMEFQRAIGADLMMAFDECTYYPATHEYAEKAMARTHEWLKRCLKYRPDALRKTTEGDSQQFLYGIIQGGTYEDLRIASAKFIAAQDVPGVAVGGVSVGESKDEMRQQVRWVAPYLPADKPVHLLGVGHVDDIIDLVKHGIDTFDCVEPTRVARMGSVYQLGPILKHLSGNYDDYEIDMQKSSYKADLGPLDESCHCYVCQHYSKAYLHHLFKQREILGYTLASYHNLAVMETLMKEVRRLVENDRI